MKCFAKFKRRIVQNFVNAQLTTTEEEMLVVDMWVFNLFFHSVIQRLEEFFDCCYILVIAPFENMQVTILLFLFCEPLVGDALLHVGQTHVKMLWTDFVLCGCERKSEKADICRLFLSEFLWYQGH